MIYGFAFRILISEKFKLDLATASASLLRFGVKRSSTSRFNNSAMTSGIAVTAIGSIAS